MSDTDTAPSRDWRHYRAKIARHAQTHPGEEPPVDLRRDLAAIRLEEHVRKIVAASPPLTQAQRDRIATLLRPGPSSAPDGGGMRETA